MRGLFVDVADERFVCGFERGRAAKPADATFDRSVRILRCVDQQSERHRHVIARNSVIG